MQRVKSRYFISDSITTILIPYISGTVKFVEDFYSQVPVHKVTLRPDMNNGIENKNKGIINDIKEFTEINNVKLPTDNQTNMFMNASSIVAFNMEQHRKFTNDQKIIVCRRITA